MRWVETWNAETNEVEQNDHRNTAHQRGVRRGQNAQREEHRRLTCAQKCQAGGEHCDADNSKTEDAQVEQQALADCWQRLHEVLRGEESFLDSWPTGGVVQSNDDDSNEDNGTDQAGCDRLVALLAAVSLAFELNLADGMRVVFLVHSRFGC